MEQNREHRNKPTPLELINIQQNTYNELMISFSINGVWEIGRMCRKMKLDHLLIPQATINSKWIKDLNVSSNTTKVLKENIGNKISDIARSNILSAISPQTRKTDEKMNKWDYIKL